jgi:hypothetical protein
VYYETAEDFTGFDPAAMWEDFKVGVEHLARWERVAVVTDVEWIGKAVRFFAFLMPAATKLFSRAEAAQMGPNPSTTPSLSSNASADTIPKLRLCNLTIFGFMTLAGLCG